MATNYQILGSEHVSESLTPTKLIDLIQITARAVPSGVVYSVRFAATISDPARIAGILSWWADRLNDLSATPGVVGILWVNDFDPSDQLVDTLSITVDSTSGVMEFTKSDIPADATQEYWKNEVATVRSQLDAIEAQ